MDTTQSPFAAAASTGADAGTNNIPAPANPQNTQTSGSDIDLGRYVRLLLNGKWIIMAAVFSAIVIVVILVKPMRSTYSAEATIVIESAPANVIQIQSLYGGDRRDRQYYATQYEIFRSRSLIEKVVDRLDLVRHPELDPRQQPKKESFLASSFPQLASFLSKEKEDEPELSEEVMDLLIRTKLVKGIGKALTVRPVYETHVVRIGFTSQDPQLAADISNAVADAYIESHFESQLVVIQKASAWLQERLGGLRQILQDSEDRLQDYKEREQLVDIAGVSTLDSGELTQLREALLEARELRIESESLYRQVRNTDDYSIEQMLAIPAIFGSLVIQRLLEEKRDADRSVVTLSKRYGPMFPVLQEALRVQGEVVKDLENQLGIVSRGLYNTYQVALDKERNIKEQIALTQKRLQNIGRKAIRLRELQREVETNQQLYDLFLSRGKETEDNNRFETPAARVIDLAVPATIPEGPNKKKFVVAAVILSAGFVSGLIILLDLINFSVRSASDVKRKLKSSTLGFLPKDKYNKSENALHGFSTDKGKMGFVESVRNIRTSILFSNPNKPIKTIMVTSSVKGEGKSTLAINLAESFGQMEKVLLVEADMRDANMFQVLGMPDLTKGLSDIILGKVRLAECIHKLPGSKVDVILAGSILKSPLELLGSRNFLQLLNHLSKNYDRIIIDSTSTGVFSDTKVTASRVDSVVYVVKSHSTPIGTAKRSLDYLRAVNAPLSGVVINNVDLDKVSKYDSYYSVFKKQYDLLASANTTKS
ncbi:MAG: succinoglycan biosynthesis transport protein ExoP [Cellvibrionaceae bacterium]|jgi:succinoglycan biosynthesis transport protein ExoP